MRRMLLCGLLAAACQDVKGTDPCRGLVCQEGVCVGGRCVRGDAASPADAAGPADGAAPGDAARRLDGAAPGDAAPSPVDTPPARDGAPPDAARPRDAAPPPRDAASAAVEIVSFVGDHVRLTEGETVTFTAVVRDPRGEATGTLLGPGDVVYGHLLPAGAPGLFRAALGWADFHAAEPIEMRGDAVRHVRARFADRAGPADEAGFDVTLYCDTGAACAGRCVDLDGDAGNCGRCGGACAGTCDEGSCSVAAAPSRCWQVDNASLDDGLTCDEVCGMDHQTCAEQGCWDDGEGASLYATPEACAQDSTGIRVGCGDELVPGFLRCCCR
jgi:hypothetical protein